MTFSLQPVVIVAPDSFKGSLSAAEAARAMARGARAVFGPAAEIIELPMADGGEGTLDSLLAAWGQQSSTIATVDALARPCTALYGISDDGRTGVIEAAQANGLPQVQDAPLQPLRADSYGVGLIAARLLDSGVAEILLCIGGSASTDGGTGVLSALGAQFLDSQGKPVRPGGAGLADIVAIDLAALHPAATKTRWRVAVDVENPLCGHAGAASVFGPQKGATLDDIQMLDAGLASFARVLAAHSGVDPVDYLDRPGFGAAGGLPLGLVALLDAETVPGARLVGDALGLADKLARADLVLTGEGSLDTQSLGGKVVDALRREAPASTPLVVIAGTVQLSAAECRAAGITAALSISTGAATLDSLVSRTPQLLEDATEHACSLLAVSSTNPRVFGK